MPKAYTYHLSVMLQEAVNALVHKPNGFYVDGTFGGGGHSKEIVTRLEAEGRLWAFDQDPEAHKNALTDTRFVLHKSNFRFLEQFLSTYQLMGKMDGLLLDLGISSRHIDAPERGFSFRFDAPLDMRMNTDVGQTAADLIAQSSLEYMTDILSKYGDLRSAQRIATAIKLAPEMTTTLELNKAVLDEIQPAQHREHSLLAKVYQAIRIALNQELSALEEVLKTADRALSPNGRLVVLTYHSLEDKIVTNHLRKAEYDTDKDTAIYGAAPRVYKVLKKEPLTPTDKELEDNPRSRSAKMRVGRKIEL